MADRDFNIPMGPDRTGELDLPPIDFGDGPSSGEQAPLDPYAAPAYPDPAPQPAPAYPDPAPQAAPVYSEITQQPAAAPSNEVMYAGYNDHSDEEEEYRAGGISEEEAQAKGIDDVQMSFLALKDSIGQGRELKAREKELDELADKIDADREELEDREDILANYQVLVADQENLIRQYAQEHDELKREFDRVSAELADTNDALARMREYHDGQMDPFETNLGRARASAEQAKNDERSRKSELSAAESELRRAESTEDSTMAAAKHEQVQAAYEEARTRSEAAKEALDQAQRAYDDAIAQVEQAESPLERTIEDLEGRASELKERIGHLEEDISTARKRRQYCDSVYQYPDETAKLRDSVRADEQKLVDLGDEADNLRNQLAKSKDKSKIAKGAIVIAAIIVIVIIVIILMFVVGH